MKKRRFLSLLSLIVLTVAMGAASAFGAGSGAGATPVPPVKNEPAKDEQVQTVPAKPKATPAVCKEDTFVCDDWSSCEMDGRQRRGCSLKNDCAGVETPKPETEKNCEGLKCGFYSDLSDRVRCRLKLTDAEMALENKILYFPEYCKAEEDAEGQQECIALYRSFQPCWQKPAGPERGACARQLIGPAPWDREQTEHFVLFSLYELEFFGEALYRADRVTLDQAVELDVMVENQKVKIEKAANTAEWKTILQETLDAWTAFKTNVK